MGGFANRTVLKPGAGGEGWDAGYAATLQVPGAEPVEEGFTWRNVLASYVHLHFGSNPKLATALVDQCRQARTIPESQTHPLMCYILQSLAAQ